MQENTLERVLLPLSGLTSWLIVMAGGLSCLHVLGINVAPLLTVGGVSTILVGLSAQSVMANMIAGVNLVRPAEMAIVCNTPYQRKSCADIKAVLLIIRSPA